MMEGMERLDGRAQGLCQAAFGVGKRYGRTLTCLSFLRYSK